MLPTNRQLTLFETGPQHLFPTMQTLHISPTREVTGNCPPVLRRVGLHDAAKQRIFLGSPFGRGRAPFGFTCLPATADQRPLAPGSRRQGSGGSCHRRSVGDARRTARQHREIQVNNKELRYGCLRSATHARTKSPSTTPPDEAKNRLWEGQRAFFSIFLFCLTNFVFRLTS